MNEGLFIFGIPCLIFVGIFIFVQNNHKHVLATIFKGLASICFLMFAIYQIIWINSQHQSQPVDVGWQTFIFVGLGFGVLGDILLNVRDLFKNPVKTYITLSGVISFLLGHIFYIVHLFKLITAKELHYFNISYIYISILIALVLAGGLSFLILKFIDKDKQTKIVAITYITVISFLVCIAGFAMIQSVPNLLKSEFDSLRNSFVVLFVACFAFAASDVILIFNSYGKHPRPWVSGINLYLYYIAQLLIGLSVFFFYM